jgi:DNA-binding LacI/PurR family transcriptional regulator
VAEKQPNIQAPPPIYDVVCAAGVSIPSVSWVLNGHRHARLATRDQVLQEVAQLENLPDGAAWALSAL